MAPVERDPQAGVPTASGTTRAADQQPDPIVDPLCQLGNRQGPGETGGQLDAERQPIHRRADRHQLVALGRGHQPGQPGPLDEQRHSDTAIQRTERVYRLPRHPQRLLRGDEHTESSCRRDQFGYRMQHVLGIVQNQHGALGAERGDDPRQWAVRIDRPVRCQAARLQCRGHRGQHIRCAAERCQLDKHDGPAGLPYRPREFGGETRLSAARDTDHRCDSRLSETCCERGEFTATTDEAGHRGRYRCWPWSRFRFSR